MKANSCDFEVFIHFTRVYNAKSEDNIHLICRPIIIKFWDDLGLYSKDISLY